MPKIVLGVIIMNRNLDGCYFRVKRNNMYQSICFSDLTSEERNEILKNKDNEWLSSLCCYLADRIKTIGEELDICCD